jgi:hypothetical protein
MSRMGSPNDGFVHCIYALRFFPLSLCHFFYNSSCLTCLVDRPLQPIPPPTDSTARSVASTPRPLALGYSSNSNTPRLRPSTYGSPYLNTSAPANSRPQTSVPCLLILSTIMILLHLAQCFTIPLPQAGRVHQAWVSDS